MRVFIAGVATETNTFAPLPTGRQGFEAMGLYFGDASRVGSGVAASLAKIARRTVEARSHEVVESVFGFAQPSGKTLGPVYEDLRDRMLADLAAAGEVDIVLLMLHGAMVAYGYDDCEGDMLARVRAMVGPQVAVGGFLDPHCHMTQAMLAHADVLVAMKEYPHIDGPERTTELFDILVRQREGRAKPVPALFDTRVIGFYPTTSEPMASFVARLKAVEQEPGVLTVSLAHGFPWADVADVGTRVLVYADGDPHLAQAWAETLGRELYDMRHQLRVQHLGIEAALDLVQDGEGLSVLADVADNPGGGAPCDNTAILRALVERQVAPSVLGCLYDPGAVETCHEAGLGASFELRIGGKSGKASGAPIDLLVTVESLCEDLVHTGLGGGKQPLGRAALVDADGVKVVLCSLRAQTFAPDAFEQMGVDLHQMRCVVVKSTQHFHAAFAPLAQRVLYVAGGGALDTAFEAFAYTKRDLNYFPRVEAPLG